MRSAEFILSEQDTLTHAWADFAHSIKPGTELALQDHIRPLLTALAISIEAAQTELERSEKSMGRADNDGSGGLQASHRHAIDRAAQRYSIADLVSEFRALRASVSKLWTAHLGGQLRQQDVEDMVRFNEAVDQLLAELVGRFARDVQESRDLFLAILGHDLRNPLSAVKNYADVLAHAPEMSAEKRQATATRLLNSVARMTTMVSGLLDVARTRFGRKLPIHRTRMALDDLCHEVVNEVRAAHPDVDIRVGMTGELDGSWDRLRMSQVISNLLGNALAHGDRTKPVTVTLAGGSAEVVLGVHNEGPAIAQAVKATMFRPFMRSAVAGNPGEAADGLGLGLYIGSQIVEAHGGSIAVESSEAQGTTFTVRLPRLRS